MCKKIGILTAVLCAFLGAQSAFADQLVTNGGFETGDFTGWTLVTSASPNSQTWGVDAVDAATGNYGAYLGTEFTPLSLSQTLTVQPGHYYSVSFSLAQDSAVLTGFSNIFTASLGGQMFFVEKNAPVSPFTTYTFTLATSPTAATSESLVFMSQNDLGYFSLDNVSVSTGAVTPEPATLLLMAPALGLLALRRRKSA